MPVGFVVVSVPPQTVVVPVATDNPAGSVSVNATPVSAVLALGFVIVNVSEVVPFRGIVVGLNAFAIDGGAITGAASTIKGALLPGVSKSPLVRVAVITTPLSALL